MERSAASNTLRRGRAKALAPPTASRRRCYNQAAHRGQALLTTDARAGQRERASAAQRRLSATLGVERDGTARRCGSGAKATGREWRKESASAGARQGRRCRDRRACDRERSWRMVVLGRRIARGGRERGAKPSPPAASGRSRSRSGTPERCPVPLALTKPALAGVGALRGVPARMGKARRRLDRGERLFPVCWRTNRPMLGSALREQLSRSVRVAQLTACDRQRPNSRKRCCVTLQ